MLVSCLAQVGHSIRAGDHCPHDSYCGSAETDDFGERGGLEGPIEEGMQAEQAVRLTSHLHS